MVLFSLFEWRTKYTLQSYLNLHSGQTYQLFPFLGSSAVEGMGKIVGLDYLLSPFLCAGTGDKGQPVHMTFLIMPHLLPFSNHSQEGNGKFSLLGPPCPCRCKGQKEGHGTIVSIDFFACAQTFLQMTSYNIQYLRHIFFHASIFPDRLIYNIYSSCRLYYCPQL